MDTVQSLKQSQAANEPLNSEQKTVLVFDIRSSTVILSNLAQQGYSQLYRNFHSELKDWLLTQRESVGIELYKFLGDGWILLLPPDVTGEVLYGFLENLCYRFDGLYHKHWSKVDEPVSVGLTVGVDLGFVYSLEMNDKKEYLGRPINLACRLQAAAKVITDGYVCLLTQRAASGSLLAYCTQNQKRLGDHIAELRNINGGQRFNCKKLSFVPELSS